jgi:hypothetical protein
MWNPYYNDQITTNDFGTGDTSRIFTVGVTEDFIRYDPIMSVTYNGKTDFGTTRSQVFTMGGADFAELYESLDGKAIEPGTPVKFIKSGKYIQACKPDEQLPDGVSLLGVISDRAGLIGNSGLNKWPHRFMKDNRGNVLFDQIEVLKYIPITEKRYVTKNIEKNDIIDGKTVVIIDKVQLYEDVQVYINALIVDKQGNPILDPNGDFTYKKIPHEKQVKVIEKVPRYVPEYDSSKEYIPREARPEWNIVGLIGQLKINKEYDNLVYKYSKGWIKIEDESDKDYSVWFIR